MSRMFEADLGHLRLVGGVQQAGHLPGIHQAHPPRRSARGRNRDRLLLSLYLSARSGGDPGDFDKLLALATRNYFGTPGTVTAATRAAFGAVSSALLSMNQRNPAGGTVQAGLTCAVWRGSELYLAQAGPGNAFVIQRASAEQFPDPERELRPLGTTNTPEIQYFHTTLNEGDILVLCHTYPNGWRTGALRTVNTGSLEPTLSRLIHLAGNDMTAAITRFIPAGAPFELPTALAKFDQRRAQLTPPARPQLQVETPTPVSGDSSLASILARVRAATDLGDEPVLSPTAIDEMSAGEPTLAPATEDTATEDTATDVELSPPTVGPPSEWDWPTEIKPDATAEPPDITPPPPPDEWIDLSAESLQVDQSEAPESESGALPAAVPDARDDDDAAAPATPAWIEVGTEAAAAPDPPSPPVEATTAPSIPLDTPASSFTGVESDEREMEAPPTPADDQVITSPLTPPSLRLRSGPASAEPHLRTRGRLRTGRRREQRKFPQDQVAEDEAAQDDLDSEEELPDRPRLRLRLNPIAGLQRGLRRLRDWYVALPLDRLRPRLEAGSTSLSRSVAGSSRNLLSRLAPTRTVSASDSYTLPDRLLIAVALLVPVLVVLVASGLYLTEGQAKQYEAVMEQARLEAGQARIAPDALAARPHWEAVVAWVTQADAIRPGQPEAVELRQEAQGVLDSLDGIIRVPVAGVTAAGFSNDARITRIVATGNDLYALDATSQSVYRAIRTVSGTYDVDRTFLCRPGLGGDHEPANVVDIAWLTGPNVVGEDALLTFDDSGIIMYCLSDGSSPATTVLTPPAAGWSSPRAIEMFADRLYVLDPDANQIWIYDRVGGVYSEPPNPYFSETIYDLSDAIDFAIAQGDLFILRRDGGLTQCTRTSFDTPDCVERALYTDERLGRTTGDQLADVHAPTTLVFDPPPEPSLYLADADNLGAYQLSLWLVFQRQYRPAMDFDQPLSAVAIGSGKDIFYAAGNNVYVGRRP